MRGEEPTFCGDLDTETGDCDLMFLAEEPADKEWGKGEGRKTGEGRGRRKEGTFKLGGGHFLPSPAMTQHESRKTHTRRAERASGLKHQ